MSSYPHFRIFQQIKNQLLWSYNFRVASLFFGFFIFMFFLAYTFLPVFNDAIPGVTWGFSVDWKKCIRPDALMVITGRSPYAEGCGLNPPWAYLLLAPIALFPPPVGAAMMFSMNFLIYSIILFRLKAKPLAMAAFLTTPLVYLNGTNGNIDWLALLGLVLPQRIGLLFLLIKPQIGAGLALFWVINTWRTAGIGKAVNLVLPTLAAYLVSFVLFGLWPLKILHTMPDDPYNSSLGMVGVVIGGVLLVSALRQKKSDWALISTPLMAPYINIHSFAAVVLGFGVNTVEFYVSIILVWIMMFVN